MMRAQSPLAQADQNAFSLQVGASHLGLIVERPDFPTDNFWIAFGDTSPCKSFTIEGFYAADAAAIRLVSDLESTPASVVMNNDSKPNSTTTSPVVGLNAVGKLRFLASAANTRKTLDGAIRLHLERG